MSFYNMINGCNPIAPILIEAIGIARESIPRFRDAWLSKDFECITLLTRTGGGNRPDYQKENAALCDNPLFISDDDDDFDNTFAKFHYHTPEGLKKELHEWLAQLNSDDREKTLSVTTKDSGQKWDEAHAAMSVKNGAR